MKTYPLIRVIHGREAVAQLKLTVLFAFPFVESLVIHGREAVAQLKLVSLRVLPLAGYRHPRSRGRGPIEAACPRGHRPGA